LRIFHAPLLFGATAPHILLWNFAVKLSVKRQKTRVMGLLCGEGCMILTSTVFDWSTHPCDRRADRRTGDSI